jgi:hypothetical protein
MVDDDTIDEMQSELERAADDLERVTEQLRERSDQVERLEALVDRMLGLLEVPVLVVGPDRRVAAMSRGAAAALSGTGTTRVLGRSAASVLPRPLAERVAAFADRTERAGQAVGEGAGRPDSGPPSEGTEADGDLVALPGGATLVVLSE